MKKVFLFFSLLSVISEIHSQTSTPTWSENIACIAYTNCTKCHQPDGVGSFSMIDYSSAYNARFAIKSAVQSGYMPPWPPNINYQTLAHERVLTQLEKDLIVAWVDGGAPEGNPAVAPVPPVYLSVSELSQIDWTGAIPVYTNIASQDDYRCFVIPTNISTDKFIKSIEILPGNRNIVHHVVVYADTTTECLTLDAADPAPGYQSFGGAGTNTSRMIAAWVPGSQYITFPDGMGIKITPNTYIILQMHYPAGTQGEVDSTRINIEYASSNVREVMLEPLLNHGTNINVPLAIPPNTTASFYEEYTLPLLQPNVMNYYSFISILPHMHKVGKKIKCYAVLPSNDTIPMISIENWDFKWQGQYSFRKPFVFPEGTLLKAEALYDNTSSNLNAPNHNAWVYAGEATNEEMMAILYSGLLYAPGDENIVIDTVTVKPTYNNCNFTGIDDEYLGDLKMLVYPNPTDGISRLQWNGLSEGEMQLNIYDGQGKTIFEKQLQVSSGDNEYPLELNGFPSGSYFVVLKWKDRKYTQPLIVK